MWDNDKCFSSNLLHRIGCCTALWLLLVFAMVWLAAPAALANGLFEDNSWQFETTADRANKAVVLDLILKQKAGAYNYSYTNTNTINYNIDGDYIDCNMTSQATGNSGSVSQDAPVGSPSITVDSTTSSSTTGNSGTGTVTAGGNSSSTDGDDSSASADGTNTVSNNQSNDGSSQSSSADGNSFSSTVSEVSGSGGEASVALNSSQSVDNTTVSSTISNSDVCRFQQ